ncbi:MAG: uncharacterized protein QOH86_943 [Sphingomonadales bacterium]|jgi:uncharacterized protein|nr:uncharacterized protein [Sphingomonadales bacterium]
MRPLLLLLSASIAFGETPAAARPADCRGVPALTGRVVDRAHLLTPAAEARLTLELAALERRTSDQVVIATLPGLGGRTVEAEGLRLGNCWGIGRKSLDNGVVILLAARERKIRIEVGKGLEGLLTDARAKAVIDEAIMPRLSHGNFDDAVQAGVAEIDRLLSGDPRRPQRRPGGKEG